MLSRSRIVRCCACVAAVVFASVVASSAVAEESLRPELSYIAEQAQSIAKQHGFKSVSVGDFVGPPNFNSSAGAGIRRVLTEELQRLRLAVKQVDSDFGISGRYLVTDQYERLRPEQREELKEMLAPHLRIEADFYDAAGVALKSAGKDRRVVADVISEFDTRTSEETLARVLGANVDFYAMFSDTESFSDNPTINSFKQKTAVIRPGYWAAAGPKSDFALRVLVGGKAVPLTMQGGQPFVTLTKGDEFELEFSNKSRTDMSVEFLLDGLSSFAFSELRATSAPGAPPKYRRWIVPKGGNTTLVGWHRNNQRVDHFQVASFAESAAGGVGATGAHGTLSVFVRSTWPKDGPFPEDEVAAKRSGAGELPTLGVGFGRAEEIRVQEDQTTREYGMPRAMITIRYLKPAL